MLSRPYSYDLIPNPNPKLSSIMPLILNQRGVETIDDSTSEEDYEDENRLSFEAGIIRSMFMAFQNSLMFSDWLRRIPCFIVHAAEESSGNDKDEEVGPSSSVGLIGG